MSSEQKDPVRVAGGIVHKDGNIFFTNRQQFEHAASLVCGTATIATPAASVPAGGEVRDTYDYAASLAISLFQKHYASDDDYASGRVVWGPLDTTLGVLTQIDNMTTGLSRTQPPNPQDAAPAVAGEAYSAADVTAAHTKGYELGMAQLDRTPPPLVQPSTGEGDEGKTSFHSDSGECDRVQGPGPTDAERFDQLQVLMKRLETARYELHRERFKADQYFKILMGIFNLLNPDAMGLADGRAMKFINPIANEVLDALSKRIRAIKSDLDAAILASEPATAGRVE